MDKEKITILADVLDTMPAEDFDMHDYFDRCGAPSCIAGYAIHLFGNPVGHFDYSDAAGEVLGIDEDKRGLLFAPFALTVPDKKVYDVTPKGAAIVLRHFVRTGEVQWSLAKDHMPNWSGPRRMTKNKRSRLNQL